MPSKPVVPCFRPIGDKLNAVLERLKVSNTIKKLLLRSVRFLNCVCKCLKLRLNFTSNPCMSNHTIGVICMRQVLPPDPCTLDCATSMMENATNVLGMSLFSSSSFFDLIWANFSFSFSLIYIFSLSFSTDANAIARTCYNKCMLPK